MRIAILILSIFAAVISFGLSAWTIMCAGCQGSATTLCGTHTSGTMLDSDTEEAYEKLFWANTIASMGILTQGVLVLTGGIVAFSGLGKGKKGKTGGILLSAGLGIGILAMLTALILASSVDKTLTQTQETIITFYIFTGIFANLLPVICVPMAFMAKPEQPQVVVVQQVVQPPPTSGV